MSDSVDVSIVIPALNEPHLDILVSQIHEVMTASGISHEVLVQDEIGLTNAVLSGVKRARGGVVVVMDGDGSHSPCYLPEMVKRLEESDVIVGSKYIEGGRSCDVHYRRFISRIFCLFSQYLLDIPVRDNMSGFIVSRRIKFEELSIVRPQDYKFGLELICRNKKSVYEYPISFVKRKQGKSKASIGQGLSTLNLILRMHNLQ